jgi:hypothetical protein
VGEAIHMSQVGMILEEEWKKYFPNTTTNSNSYVEKKNVK